MARKRNFPPEVYNLISLAGVGLALFGLAAVVILWIMNILSGKWNSSLRIFTYRLVPGVVVIRLLLIPFGTWRRRRRIADGDDRVFVLDLGLPQHRNALVVFITGTSIFLLLATIGLYEAYHYSESVE